MQNQTDQRSNAPRSDIQLPPGLCAMPDLWNQQQLADYIGKSTAWCERARWAGEGPKFIKLGRHVRYRADDVMAWINSNVRTSTTVEVAQ